VFDVIGDVHGCIDELQELLGSLGYVNTERGYIAPKGRSVVFVGDLNDRGPDSASCLKLAMDMVGNKQAHMVLGNHEYKLFKILRSQSFMEEYKGNISHDLSDTLLQIYKRGPQFVSRVFNFLKDLPTVFESGSLIVAHGAYDPSITGGKGRDFNLFGETDGTKDKNGYPNRLVDWKKRYQGTKTIVTGHDPLYESDEWQKHWKFETENGTCIFNIDWGCCFGGELVAYQHPEGKIVTVKARQTYKVPKHKRQKV